MPLSVTELRLHASSSLEDGALQNLLDAAYEAIDSHLGATGPIQELIRASGNGPLLMLSRRAVSIHTIIENSTLLADDDYELRSSGQMVLRLVGGTHRSRWWRGLVDVTYSPYIDDAERDRVAIALVNLDLNYKPGLVSETIGDWSEQFARNDLFNYNTERNAILASLGAPVMIL